MWKCGSITPKSQKDCVMSSNLFDAHVKQQRTSSLIISINPPLIIEEEEKNCQVIYLMPV